MNEFIDNLTVFFGRLSTGQRLGLFTVLIGGIIGLISLAYWTQRPDYMLLFGQLNSEEANQVVETLRTESVPYQLKEDGTAIYVPRERVHELRLQFAGEGVVSDGTTGYELFDQNTLGMTNFMQQMNKKRALEGELARTITSLQQVESGRVHLVTPERSPFREVQEQPSASVILKLKGNVSLTENQIRGVVALVAGAVQGLEAANVAILDTKGNMLSNPDASNKELQMSNARLRLKRELEEHLTDKGQSMLDKVLGSSNAILRVSAELDFTRKITENETVDPESRTVISEERLEEDTEGADANSLVRNYEMSRSAERIENDVARLSYLTVSVMLNHKRSVSPEEENGPTYEPYTPEELNELENMVKNAVGFRPERGDRISIQQTRFDGSTETTLAQQIRQQQRQEQIRQYIRYGLMLLGILAALWLIRSTSKRVTNNELTVNELENQQQNSPQLTGDTSNLPVSREEPSEEDIEDLVLVDDIYTSKLSPEARAKLKAKHRMFDKIREDVLEAPESTANLIHTWIIEDGMRKNSAKNKRVSVS